MSSKTVKDLAPGDPEEIWLHADYYNRMAIICEEVGHGFRTIDVGIWYGRAAEAFHARFERQPKRFLMQADCYLEAAIALDTYASVLAWAQRQAGEVVALSDTEDSPPEALSPVDPALTLGQQAELVGVITGADQPKSEPARVDHRALALDAYRRATAMLDTVGNESAAAVMAAAEMMPGPLPTLDTADPPRPRTLPDSSSSSTADLVVLTVLPAPTSPAWFDPSALRDDLQDWAVGIEQIRKRLRWNGLNRLSSRLMRHIFEGHYKPSIKDYNGYHHREGGVDHDMLRIVRMLNGPDQDGVYEAEWRGPRTPSGKTKTSTFFPDSWSRAEVLRAVRHAFLDAMGKKDTQYDAGRRRFRGVYKGVRVEGYVKRGAAQPGLCDIMTAYPRGKWRQGRRKR
jgi:hypothetical protein